MRVLEWSGDSCRKGVILGKTAEAKSSQMHSPTGYWGVHFGTLQVSHSSLVSFPALVANLMKHSEGRKGYLVQN